VLDGLEIMDCFDSLQGLNSKLIGHYKSSAIKQLYKIFGALNIIGNPISLFKNISTGFQDLKEKPAEGLVKGPLEFGKGLAEGASSLIAHSVGGALNSVEKVTGTIASGLAALTFDKEFETMREREKMKKPKHVFEGIEKGGLAVFHGFKEGITGLLLKPIENTKKEGAIGLLKGAGQGLAGLVIKPVSGIVDFASTTTEGLKNTALYL
jgi:vacuolar protein sorting-associated protein 13A/C